MNALDMEVEALIWVLLPVFVAAGSALLSYSIMHARMEVAVAKEREQLAEAQASIQTYKITLEERIRATEEETRRRALNEFMQEFRVEERHYIRENKSATMRRKIMVMQERLYFRNLPLSNWVEHELVMEEESQLALEDTAKTLSVFNAALKAPADSEPVFAGRLLS
jgi:hypothetical protein